jgi:hypothetical protein
VRGVVTAERPQPDRRSTTCRRSCWRWRRYSW